MITHLHIGDDIHFNREDAYTFNGKVLALNEGSQKALVQWVDCLGQTRQMMVAVEFLTVIGKQTAEAVAGSAVA